MANVVKSDTTGEILTGLKRSTSFSAVLVVNISPSGDAAIRLETPPIVVRRVSRNIEDNPEYQQFLVDMAPLNAKIGELWGQFWERYKQRLDNKELT